MPRIELQDWPEEGGLVVKWRVIDGPIDHSDTVRHEIGNSFQHTMEIALKCAMSYYYMAARRISSDGP
jgi:hypothetical protein